MSRLLAEVRSVLELAERVVTDPTLATQVREVAARLDEPLRVAIAGKVKAGKSTLLNALVGDELAPTDAGECTRIVTWYRHGITYRVLLTTDGADPVPIPFHRDAGALEVDLQGRDPDDVDRLEVQWPTPELTQLTLVDTPGLGSIASEISDRSVAFLTPDDERVTPADAVIYLMRHLHTADLRFLESFHDHELAQPLPINAIGVLSRADEIAVGRIDAMASAAKIATRYRADPKVRRLVQTVVPVAGLLAQSGSTVREAEHQALATLAARPVEDTDALLLSADRFVAAEATVGLTDLERTHLLDRFGLFGVRLSIQLLRSGRADTARELAAALVAHSGLDQLRSVLRTQFTGRADLLKARSALLALDELARSEGGAGGAELAAAIERVQAGAHEFAEIRLLNALRLGVIPARPDELRDLERLLGADGADTHARLGLDDGDDSQVRTRLGEELVRWQRRAENPLSTPELQDACRVAMRTCEGLAVTVG
jgi:predicted GTPase